MLKRILKNSLIFTGLIVLSLLFHVLLLDRNTFFKEYEESQSHKDGEKKVVCYKFPCSNKG